ncbi:MAG: sulfite exporter TauE/SafE family protein [SAR202 cluster bacterium]|nr:sulfite exporter TauE/SafE family protein [SAR202 cluster bacterium]
MLNINDISLPTLTILFFVIFISSTVQSTTSFGFNLIATPIFLIFFDPEQVIPILMPLTASVNIGIILLNSQIPEFKKSSILIFGGLIGIPIGIIILSKSHPDYLKISTGLIILTFAILTTTIPEKLNFKRNSIQDFIIGLGSGIFATSTSLSGPLIVLYLTNTNTPKAEFRRIISCFLLFIQIFSIITLIFAGYINLETLTLGVKLLPAIILPFFIAIKILKSINENLFKSIVLGIVIFSSISAIMSSLIPLI